MTPRERYKAKKDPDWTGRLRIRFRWLHLRYEYGRWNYVVEPIDRKNRNILSWWEWQKK